jgi:hypothetical protein
LLALFPEFQTIDQSYDVQILFESLIFPLYFQRRYSFTKANSQTLLYKTCT